MLPSLSLPQPCLATWADMTPTAAGRHCATCHTEVVDFTQKSSAEILAYLRQASDQPVCGRVCAAQLVPPVAVGSRWGRWVGTLLVVSSLSTIGLPKLASSANLDVANLQAKPAPTSANLFQVAPKLSRRLEQRLAASTLIVRGVVLDARTRTPAPGITILLKDTNWSTSTNADGKFELTVVAKGQHVELVVALPGYKTLVKRLSLEECKEPITILLQQETILLGRISPATLPRG
jgi:hypothetical protein